MDLKEENILGGEIAHHWYYKSKASALLRFVSDNENKVILDIGAGSGFFTKYLMSNTSAKEGICVDISYPEEWHEQVAGKKIQFRKNCGPVDADLVLLMDVLEHVDNDIELLREYVEKVPEGTQFLISVPAFNFLWSNHDVFLEHKRRYTLNTLSRVVNSAGLRKQTICYYFGLVFPLVAAVRLGQHFVGKQDNVALKSDLKVHGAITNYLLTVLCSMELPFFKINKVAGVSIFCLCEK